MKTISNHKECINNIKITNRTTIIIEETMSLKGETMIDKIEVIIIIGIKEKEEILQINGNLTRIKAELIKIIITDIITKIDIIIKGMISQKNL